VKIDDRYQILDKIGAGSYATVYRARDNELGREVAIKQIHEQYLQDPKLLDRYWTEAQLLASLQHPNIVTIFDIVRDRGWLVMELMQANLRDRLQGRQMDLKSLKTTLAHCLRALKYLHSRGVLHGDLKPSNLMIDHRKRVKLGDFGLARRVSDEDGSLLKGTAKYIAPEVVSDDFGEVGPQSDLYSLGFSCYELMCGTDHFEDLFPGLSAFARDKQAAWIMWHAAPDRRLPEIRRVLEGVPEDLATVIQGLTEKDRGKRYASADEALSDLHVDLKLIKQGGEENETIEEAPPPDGKRRMLLIGVFAASLLMSALMLFMPSGPATGPKQAVNTVGIVRSVDGAAASLVYEDPVEGLPKELKLGGSSRIKLIRPGEDHQYILPKEIEAGSWIEIERASDPDSGAETINLIVSRPITSLGTVTKVDTAGERVTVAVTDGKVRTDIDMSIPPRAELQLNGAATILNQLRMDDRVEVTFLLDPSGRKGHIAAALSAWRREDLVAHVEKFDAETSRLTAHMGRPDGPLRSFAIDGETRITQASGEMLTAAELQPGDYIRISADTHAYTVIVTRNQQQAVGSIIAVNEPNRLLVVRKDAGGEIVNLEVPIECPITLSQQPAQLSDLRAEFDRVTAHYGAGSGGTGSGSTSTATSIDVVRPARHDRWGAILSTRAYADRDLTPLTYSTEDGQLLHDVLISHYANDPAWLLNLMDQNMAKVRESLASELASVGRSTQVIIAVFGHAYLGPDDRVYLALKDFRDDDMPATGLPLDGLIDLLEACPSTDKLLLLDVVHAGDGADLTQQPPLPDLLAKLQSKPQTTRILGAASAGERGLDWPDQKHGVFAYFLAQAFRGAADADKNVKLSANELLNYLQTQMSAAALPAGAKQTPFIYAQ
jgi:serine/threonine-protein kinase